METSLEWCCILVRSNYGRKLLMSIKCHNLHSYKEVIVLRYSILKQVEYHFSLAQLSLKFI